MPIDPTAATGAHLVNDLASGAIRVALRGLAARQRAIADNVANSETPGFRAGRVTFEDSLRAAVAAGDPTTADVARFRSTAPRGPNGNNVVLEEELVNDTDLRYGLMVEAMSNKFRLLRTAIGGGR